ncbi:MAG TPA: VWA domain-containing protein [Gemmatimonadaceae bacterium]|nr:VWA domain-containing protein [Gemmatimonadaceae bacterium]
MKICLLMLAVYGLLLLDASPPAQDTPPQKPVFRSESEVVTVDVVVLDKRGDAVRDLAQADFTIAEDGRSQVVRFFQPVVTSGVARQGPPRTERSYGYSTNVGTLARPERSFVLFFDDVHLTHEQGERVKKAIEQFLATDTEAGDLVSLVAPARGLRWHARLPDGRAELIRVLTSLHGSVQPEAPQERISDYEAYRIHVLQDEQMAERVGRRFSNFHVFGRDQGNTQTDQGPRPETKGGTAGLIEPLVQVRAAEAYRRAAAQNRATLGALTSTLESMAPVRGRKSIVLFSPGFILDQELPLFQQVDDAARRANIAMYFVDARGLEVQSVFASAQFGSPLDSRDVGAANADASLEAEGSVSIAESSGGFAVQNSNDLTTGLRRIGQESRVYYLLGYTPSETHADGKFRRITVRVGRPDVQVRARKGYYPGPASSKPADVRTTLDALETALESPYDLAAVPLRATSYVFGNVNPTASSVLVAVEADLRAFQLRENAGGLTDQLEFRLLVTDVAAGETKRHERTVEMTLQSRVPKIETSAWYPLSAPFELPPGRYQARVAVRDRNSGRVGSLTHDFDVPERNGLSLSSVIVTDTVEMPAQGSSEVPRPVLIVRRLLPAGATLYYQYSVFNAKRTPEGETRVKAGHIVRRADGTIVKELKPTPLRSASGGLSRFAGVSLAGMAAGDYELTLNVIDEVSGETATVREPFALAEPQWPF